MEKPSLDQMVQLHRLRIAARECAESKLTFPEHSESVQEAQARLYAAIQRCERVECDKARMTAVVTAQHFAAVFESMLSTYSIVMTDHETVAEMADQAIQEAKNWKWAE